MVEPVGGGERCGPGASGGGSAGRTVRRRRDGDRRGRGGQRSARCLRCDGCPAPGGGRVRFGPARPGRAERLDRSAFADGLAGRRAARCPAADAGSAGADLVRAGRAGVRARCVGAGTGVLRAGGRAGLDVHSGVVASGERASLAARRRAVSGGLRSPVRPVRIQPRPAGQHVVRRSASAGGPGTLANLPPGARAVSAGRLRRLFAGRGVVQSRPIVGRVAGEGGGGAG